jgi:hypothetical protein
MSPATPLARAVRHSRRLAVLAVVPFLVAVLRWNDVVAVGTDGSTRFSVTFPTPHSFVTLWSFLDAPTEGGGVDGGTLPLVVGAGVGLLFVVSLAAFVVLSGLALAGYPGSIAEGVATGSFDFAANVRRYARPMVAYQSLSVLVLLGLVAVGTTGPAPFAVLAVALFALAYLAYLTPYLVVVEDRALPGALYRSVDLTTGRAGAAVAFVGFLVVGALLSLPLSALAYGNGVAGVVLAAALAAPLGFLASVFFVVLTRDLVGIAGTTTGPSDDPAGA